MAKIKWIRYKWPKCSGSGDSVGIISINGRQMEWGKLSQSSGKVHNLV
jgi:hypothetical protein